MSQSRTPVVAALLAITLGLTSLLAYEAFDAARSHRAAAESALKEYAGFAAAEVERRARDSISITLLFGLLRPALPVNASAGQRLPPPSILADTAPPARGAVPAGAAVRFLFLVRLNGAPLETSGAAPSPEESRWLDSAVGAAARVLGPTGRYFALVSGAPDRRPEAAAILLKFDAQRRPSAAYGAVFPLRYLAPVFARVVAGTGLLPNMAPGLPNDSVLAVRVAGPDGEDFFRTSAPFTVAYAAEQHMGPFFGRLRLAVSPRPEAAAGLLIGGLPSSRLPVLAGLLVLAAALLGAAVLTLRREAELARLRDDFVASVSHELRTPLAQIRMFSETLLLGRIRSPEEQRRSLEIMAQESRRLTHLVENLLHFSRSANAKAATVLVAEPLDLEPLLRDVVSGFAPLAAARSVTVELEVPAGLEVRTDPDGLRQMILNLLDNTLKYGPEGQRVRITARAAADPGRVLVAVDDEGPGVPPADRERVFERFTRLDRNGSHRAVAGSGIGLAVVRELAERQGGRAWVEDAPAGGRGAAGAGARFVIELPAGDAEPPP